MKRNKIVKKWNAQFSSCCSCFFLHPIINMISNIFFKMFKTYVKPSENAEKWKRWKGEMLNLPPLSPNPLGLDASRTQSRNPGTTNPQSRGVGSHNPGTAGSRRQAVKTCFAFEPNLNPIRNPTALGPTIPGLRDWVRDAFSPRGLGLRGGDREKRKQKRTWSEMRARSNSCVAPSQKKGSKTAGTSPQWHHIRSAS